VFALARGAAAKTFGTLSVRLDLFMYATPTRMRPFIAGNRGAFFDTHAGRGIHL